MTRNNNSTGAAMAAILAAGIGCAAMGIMTIISEATHALGGALAWIDGVGPLSGKTGVAIIVWLVAWVVLHGMVGRRNVALRPALTWSYVLIAIGFLGTFPPVFLLFE